MSLQDIPQIATTGLRTRLNLHRYHKIVKCTRYRRVVVLKLANGWNLAFGRKIPCWTVENFLAVRTPTRGYWTFEESEARHDIRIGRVAEDFNHGTWRITEARGGRAPPRNFFDNLEALPFDTALDTFLSRGLPAINISTINGNQSTITHPQATTTPSILRLPTEMLREIMLQMTHQELDFFRSTCRRLRAISKDQLFDSQLFRPSTPMTLPPSFDTNRIDIHPVLANLDPWYRQISQIRYWASQGSKILGGIEKASCWNQMATHPPLTIINFQLGGNQLRTVEAPSGVTVGDFVRELMSYIGQLQAPHINQIWSIDSDDGQISALPNIHLRYHAWAGFPLKYQDPHGNLALQLKLEVVQFVR